VPREYGGQEAVVWAFLNVNLARQPGVSGRGDLEAADCSASAQARSRPTRRPCRRHRATWRPLPLVPVGLTAEQQVTSSSRTSMEIHGAHESERQPQRQH